MKQTIENIRKTRTFLLNMVSDLSIEQLNEIPAGFNNNIIWNVGHLVAAQQGLCYIRSGLPMLVDDQYFNTFKMGSRPERYIDASEMETIRQLLFTTLDHLESDYESNLFQTYGVFKTRYEVEIKNIDDAINFLPFHEGMHMGYIMAQKRLVKKS